MEVLIEAQEIFTLSQQLFALDEEEKMLFAWMREYNIGYVGVERERLDPTKKGDLKEAFNGKKTINNLKKKKKQRFEFNLI